VVYRFSWLAGVAGILFALVRLERLLRSTVDGLPWEAVLLVAALLGAALTWAGLAYRLSAPVIVAVNLAAMLLAVVRLAVPATTWSIFPTASSFPALWTELSYAFDVIRTGVAPVLPLAGIVALLAVVFWLLGALLATGLRRDRPYLAVLAPLVAYLQFATMDRRRSGAWTALFVVLLGLALFAVAADRRRRGTGLLTFGPGREAVGRTRPALVAGVLIALVAVTLGATSALARTLPRTGLLDWRAESALTGGYYGSISFNPFVGIQQQLVNPTDTPLFYAEISGDVPYDRVYFRLLTLESFNGAQWYSDHPRVGRPEEVDGFEDADVAFHGPSAAVAQKVTILALQQEWLPAAYSPTAFTADNRAVASGYRIKVDDGALRLDALTYRGMTYTVGSAVPLPDLEVLARDATGAVSPVFADASAAEAGYEAQAGPPPPAYELPERDKYLDLPDGIDPGIASLSARQVLDLDTDFEKALALEAFFRDSGGFRYSIEVSPGHAASDLRDWLLDPLSPNYRAGYCEQFATAMAVMARLVGLPSRVVLGFTPGWLYEDDIVVVSDRNAHAWVELWMPSQGWVRFDPTPRGDGVNPAASDGLTFRITDYLPGDTTPSTFDITPPSSITLPDEEPVTTGFVPLPPVPGSGWRMPGLPVWLLPTLAALVLAFGLLPAVKWARRRHRLDGLATGDVSGAWREMVDRLSDLGDEPAPAATPLEVAVATDAAMVPLARTYGESIYGRPKGRSFDLAQVAIATRSFQDTEGRFRGRYSPARRLLSWYRLRSLAPRRWRARHR
jgi:transglutaminase-like putative cysteine protease